MALVVQDGEEWVRSSQGEFTATAAGRGMGWAGLPCQGMGCVGWRLRCRRSCRRTRARLPPALETKGRLVNERERVRMGRMGAVPVAGKDDVFWFDGLVESAFWGVEKGEV